MDDGNAVIWSLRFGADQYRIMAGNSTLDAQEGGESLNEKLDELIVQGFGLHHIRGCSTRHGPMTTLGDGSIEFLGVCTIRSRPMPAAGI